MVSDQARRQQVGLTLTDFRGGGAELPGRAIRLLSLAKEEQLEYSFIDTLLRLYEDDRPRAKKLALDIISVLEAWVLERSLNQALPERLTIRWYGVLITALDRDQRDALTYAYQILKRIRDKFARLCGKFLTLHRFTTNYGAIRDPKPSPTKDNCHDQDLADRQETDAANRSHGFLISSTPLSRGEPARRSQGGCGCGFF